MANHKSAKKRIEVSARQNLENKRVRSALKTQLKKFYAALDANDKDIDAILKQTISAIDSAASKGVIHKNAASRKKSQVAKKVASA
ncbi:MAG: 30S ribosomal protein S20 [Eubacteriales bacterium]